MLPHKRINADKKHPLYWIWNSMHVRCYYPSHKQYKDYGGRGIRVCASFFDFEFFVYATEMCIGKRPSKKHTLDRIDNEEGYHLHNLRWSTRREQLRNRRRND